MENNKKEEYALEKLESYVKEWKIFIDTCSLLHPAADKFWMNIIPFLEKYQAKVIIPFRSVEELQKHAANKEDADLARRSNNTLKILVQLRNAGYIEIRGEKTDNFADNVFQVVFTKFRMTHKLLLITQDRDLARDILSLNESKAVRAYPVHVQRVNRYGFLSGFKANEEQSRPAGEKESMEPDEIFKVCDSVTAIADTPMGVSHIPGQQECTYTVQLCVTILEKIKYLHSRNIIIGDINPANILVVSPQEVYFVDTDSYQIEDFPCPVGTINYTAPEIQRKRFPEFLRTMGNENFAIATLLFMIMLPGKPPYSQQGGEDPIANIVNMDFSYPFGESSNRKTPDGPWRYIWSHLTYDLKKAFYNTFRKDGENAAEDTRLSVDEWLPIFKYYLELLDSGRYGKQDKMSEELFPTRHKKNPKTVFTSCKLCGNEVAENMCQNGICRECLSKGEVYSCKKCGRDISYTNYQKYIKNARKYDICPQCFEQGKKIKYAPICVECGETFHITNSQYDYFMEKGLDLPKRCPSCRAEKRKRMDETDFQPDGQYSGENGSFCFITTAVCSYYGKPDNCRELTLLRAFRDTWLKNQPGGQEAIAKYYRKAPLLVSLLQASEQYEEYCEILWDRYICPCARLIEEAMSKTAVSDTDWPRDDEKSPAFLAASQREAMFEECEKLYYGMVKYLEDGLGARKEQRV